MKKIIFLTVAFLFLQASSEAAESLQDKFLGTWRLVSLEEAGADGSVHKVDCTGILNYSKAGFMQVQVMYKNEKSEVAANQVQYSKGGFEASFGKYEIDETKHTYSYHIEGALVRSFIGQNQIRAFELKGKQLIVKSSDPKEKWKVTWEHE